MLRFLHILGTCLIPLLFSCEKTYGIEASLSAEISSKTASETTISVSVGLKDSVHREQAILFSELENRHQIQNLECSKGVWSIQFYNGRTARFSDHVFPFIQVDDKQEWTISGHPTGIAVTKNQRGDLQPPTLTMGESGFWTLDNQDTSLPTESYQAFLREEGNASLNVIGFLVHEDHLSILLSDSSVRKYSILREGFYLVPDYWMEHLVEKEKKVEAAIQEADGNWEAFAFFTDAHWGHNYKHSPALIRHLAEFTPVSSVFFGGDVITTNFSNPVAAMQMESDFQASFSFLGPNFYCLFGNHDDNTTSQSGMTERHLSEEQVISCLQSQMTELDRKDGYNFYFDDPISKTRFIGLDTGRFYISSFQGKAPQTARFLIESLDGVPEGWHIVVLSHIWAVYKAIDGKGTSVFTTFYNSFLKIIDDYNARRRGGFVYKTQLVPYDFTDGKADIICCLGGHTHVNSLLYSEGGEPVIIVGMDSLKNSNLSSYRGTYKEQRIATIVLDYTHRIIHLIYIGNGEDRVIEMPLFSNN